MLVRISRVKLQRDDQEGPAVEYIEICIYGQALISILVEPGPFEIALITGLQADCLINDEAARLSVKADPENRLIWLHVETIEFSEAPMVRKFYLVAGDLALAMLGRDVTAREFTYQHSATNV